MGKSTINHHFRWLFVCLPGRVPQNIGRIIGSHVFQLPFLANQWINEFGDFGVLRTKISHHSPPQKPWVFPMVSPRNSMVFPTFFLRFFEAIPWMTPSRARAPWTLGRLRESSKSSVAVPGSTRSALFFLQKWGVSINIHWCYNGGFPWFCIISINIHFDVCIISITPW
jgi:hypothetical protein